MATLLLIDEEAYLLRHFLPAAETAGYQVQGTANIEEGVRMARRFRPDVILLNVLPPDGVGTLLCKEVKTDPIFAGTSLMFFSNEQPPTGGQNLPLPDADEYVPKPISSRDLLARIHLLLRLKKAEQQVVQAHLDIRHKQHTLQMMQQELHTLRQQQRQPAQPLLIKEEKPVEPEKPVLNLTLPVGCCRLNKFSMILELNPIAAEYLNLSGTTGVDTLFPDYLAEDDVTPFFDHLSTVFASGTRQTCEFRIRSANGAARYLLAESVVIPKSNEASDEWVMALTDITPYKRRQHRAEHQMPAPLPPSAPVSAVEAFPVQAILEAVEEGIIVADTSGRMVFFNSRMEKLTGYSKDETQDRETFLTLLYPNAEHYQRAMSSMQAALLNGRIRNVETLVRAKNGTLKSLLVSIYSVHFQNQDWVLSTYRERSMATLLQPERLQRRKLRPKKTSRAVAQFPRCQETSVNQPAPQLIRAAPAPQIERKTRLAESVSRPERKARPAEPIHQFERKTQPAEPVRQGERKARPPEPVRQFGRKTRKEQKKKALCVS